MYNVSTYKCLSICYYISNIYVNCTSCCKSTIDQIASSSSSQYIFWVALRTFFHVAHVCCLLVVVLRGSVSPLAVVLPFSSVSTITTPKQFTTAFILTANFTPPLWTHCFLSCLLNGGSLHVAVEPCASVPGQDTRKQSACDTTEGRVTPDTWRELRTAADIRLSRTFPVHNFLRASIR